MYYFFFLFISFFLLLPLRVPNNSPFEMLPLPSPEKEILDHLRVSYYYRTWFNYLRYRVTLKQEQSEVKNKRNAISLLWPSVQPFFFLFDSWFYDSNRSPGTAAAHRTRHVQDVLRITRLPLTVHTIRIQAKEPIAVIFNGASAPRVLVHDISASHRDCMIKTLSSLTFYGMVIRAKRQAKECCECDSRVPYSSTAKSDVTLLSFLSLFFSPC
ncbi:hypothetical protein HOY80DRAFT_992074 [Tuber brumale]|nr:hypothetical protein HOY80DRAFT_992074 [Tuber brumale]